MSGTLGAVATAWREPRLWSLGLLGFLARGGLLVILLPMLAVPSPVGFSVLVGPDLVDANGLSDRVLALVVITGLVAIGLVACATVLAAIADVGLFEGLLAARNAAFTAPAGMAQARLVAQLVVLQVLALVPAMLAAVPAAASTVDATRREILLPSSQTTPLWLRVVEGAWGALAIVLLLLLLAGHIYGWLSRELLAQRVGLISRRGWRASLPGAVAVACVAAVRRPWRALGATALAGLVQVVAMAAAVLVIGIGWTAVQAAFLDAAAVDAPVAWPGTVVAALLGFVAAVLLVALLGLVLVVLAAVAAMRAALVTRAMVPVGAWPAVGDWC